MHLSLKHCDDSLCHRPNLLMPGKTFKETSMQPTPTNISIFPTYQ